MKAKSRYEFIEFECQREKENKSVEQTIKRRSLWPSFDSLTLSEEELKKCVVRKLVAVVMS